MVRLVPGSSPVVEKTFHKRRSKVVARRAVSSACMILFIMTLLYVDMSYKSIFSQLGIDHPGLWYLECVAVVYFLFRLLPVVVNLVKYTHSYLTGDVVELNEDQARLLGVHRTETGFKISPKKSVREQSPIAGSCVLPCTPSSQTSFTSDTSRLSPASYPSPIHHGSFVYSPSQHSPNSFQTVSPSQSMSQSMSQSQSFERSLNLSSANTTASKFDLTDPITGHSGLRPRNVTYSKLSPASVCEPISDIPTLARYLKEQEDKERRSFQASPEPSGGGLSSFWSYGLSPMDHVNVLRKYQYQVAPRSPQSPTANTSCSDQSAAGMEEVWWRLGVTEDNLYLWTERLRRWLSLTIIIKLGDEIEKANAVLQSLGCEELQIGDCSISTLKQLALTKGKFIPFLNAIIPYLDVSSNQEYVVKRIKDLATGSMSAFSWKSGGDYGKPWGEHLPTDSVLIVHLLCTYLDSLLPTQPRYVDGKTFTSQHFIKTPDKPSQQEKADAMYLYQTSINPPCYQVIIGEETFNLPKGRNNMFQAVLLFFYYIKIKRGEMLGRVNIGMSGLNIMWIFS